MRDERATVRRVIPCRRAPFAKHLKLPNLDSRPGRRWTRAVGEVGRLHTQRFPEPPILTTANHSLVPSIPDLEQCNGLAGRSKQLPALSHALERVEPAILEAEAGARN